MKRTCLQKNTNTDEQNTCEFHPAEITLEEQHLDPKEIQQVICFVRMKTRLLIVVLSVFCSFSAMAKVIEASHSKKPTWVNGMLSGYIIQMGVSNDLEGARTMAMNKVKEAISQAIAVQVRTNGSVVLKNEFNNYEVKSQEKYSYEHSYKTPFDYLLKGISASVEDIEYYWEIRKSRKDEGCYYHIKYPFSEETCQQYIRELEEGMKRGDELIDNLMVEANSIQKPEQILDLVKRMRTIEYQECSLAKKTELKRKVISLLGILGTTRLEVVNDALGVIVFKLLMNGKEVETDYQPDVTAPLLQTYNLKKLGKQWQLNYTVRKENQQKELYVELNLDFEGLQVKKAANIKYSNYLVKLTFCDDCITLSSDSYSDPGYTIRFNVCTESSQEFYIVGYDLMVNRHTTNWLMGTEYFTDLPLQVNDSNFRCQGKGTHQIEMKIENKIDKLRYGLGQSTIRGKIFYKSSIDGEVQTCEFDQVAMITTW